ncbi:penicillin-binding protein 1B [Lactococcus hodotermopsidis]|uniref:Penicillin-binding protein 1B n=1 Tax=Pseudolactococcus hodotermopsidis TaxID=2709157 RepID=A0A6A0BD67_9LACT|nr:transglycosylase domain-containing protein [Lactococcus hodotermopsidis]GFH42766.1 penicillin-binding protein 1B [Lactococcus hodotermopsidis]
MAKEFSEEERKRLKQQLADKKTKRLEKVKQKEDKKNPDKGIKQTDGKTILQTSFIVVRGLGVVAGVIVLLVGVFGVATGTGYLVSLISDVKLPSKTFLTDKINTIPEVSSMTYSNGQKISEISSDLVRKKISSDDISPNIKNALIATEDENFESHHGVVPKAFFRALLGESMGGATSGGSTITQQLIKQQILGDSPTFKRKATEMVYALELEKQVSKDKILTDYLNISPFGRNNKGQNIAGVEAAAQGIFGTTAKELTIPEAAFIAGLPQSPIVYTPYGADGNLKSKENLEYGIARQKNVLYNLYRNGYISQKEYEEYVNYDISTEFIAPESVETVGNRDYLYQVVYDEAVDKIYDYLIKVDKVSETDQGNDAVQEHYRDMAEQDLQQGGYTITSTIDQEIYSAMQVAVRDYGYLLQDGTGEVQPGNVLMDNKTGAVLGFIGGLDYNTNQNNHAFDTHRNPGSSIKPIIAYGPAIDLGLLGSASRLSNYPTKFADGKPIMHDTSDGTQEMMTLQDALDTSWNIPAYWTYQTILQKGNSVKPYMSKMNYKISSYEIESLPLGGGIEPTVVQHTNGYQTLLNGGKYVQYHTIASIKDGNGKEIYQHENKEVQIYSKATSSIMAELLKGPIKSQKTTTFYGQLSTINPTLAAADWVGKTGTSNDFVDIWLMLGTPAVTLGGWVGHDSNTSMSSMMGYDNNSQYMAQLANAIYQANPAVFGVEQKFEMDASVIKSTVLKATGEKPGSFSGGNYKNFTISGETTTSLWAKTGAPTTQYKFAIGGSDNDYVNAWAQILGKSTLEVPTPVPNYTPLPSSEKKVN